MFNMESGIFLCGLLLAIGMRTSTAEYGQPYILHDSSLNMLHLQPSEGRPIHITPLNAELQTTVPQTAFLDPRMSGMNPGLSAAALARSHDDRQDAITQDHHFMTRPASFINSGPNMVRLPHPVNTRPDMSIAPSGSRTDVNTVPTGSTRPLANGIFTRLQSRPMVSIFAQNVMIEPKITHVSMETPGRTRDVIKPLSRPFSELPPLTYNRRPVLHGLDPSSKSVPNTPLQEKRYIQDQRPSLLLRSDVSPVRLPALIPEENLARPEASYQFSPLLTAMYRAQDSDL